MRRRPTGGLVPLERIEREILTLREQRVMLDADLARLYGVTTKRLNEQVKRNIDRFPADFMFQLTQNEKLEVVANCDHLRSFKFSPQRPYAFTEHGQVASWRDDVHESADVAAVHLLILIDVAVLEAGVAL